MSRYKTYEIASVLFQPLTKIVEDPILIVGSGRCGTTLLYRILKSHPSIAAFPSEANDLWHPALYPYSRRKIDAPPYFMDPLSFSRISREHWPVHHKKRIVNTLNGYQLFFGRGRSLLVGSAMITFLLPEIISMFPSSKIIHISRNGPSVVQSFYKKEWDKYKPLIPDKNQFKMKIAAYWNDNVLFMETLKGKLSHHQNAKLLDVSYEALCDQTDTTLSTVGDFLNVDPKGIKFDLQQIRNMNFKVGNYHSDKHWVPILDMMQCGMKLKGYAQQP